MIPAIRIVILLLLLFFGAYATHRAEKQVEEHRVIEMRMRQLKRALTENDYSFMKVALNAVDSGREHDHTSPSVSLIVKDGKIIGTGWDPLNSLTDPTAHAVLEAVKEASHHLGITSLEGCVIYSSTQPCPMCLSLLYLTKVDKIIYFGAPDSTGKTDIELLNQQVYGSLMRDPSKRTIPEIVLLPDDMI